VTGFLLISFDGDDGDVIEVRALTLLAQREVRALSCALSLRAMALTCKGLSTS